MSKEREELEAILLHVKPSDELIKKLYQWAGKDMTVAEPFNPLKVDENTPAGVLCRFWCDDFQWWLIRPLKGKSDSYRNWKDSAGIGWDHAEIYPCLQSRPWTDQCHPPPEPYTRVVYADGTVRKLSLWLNATPLRGNYGNIVGYFTAEDDKAQGFARED